MITTKFKSSCINLRRIINITRNTQTRSFASVKKGSRYTRQLKPQPGEAGWRGGFSPLWRQPRWRKIYADLKRNPPKPKTYPTFQEVYRGFQMQAHPDRLEQFPRQKEINTDNISNLNDFLDIIRLRSKTDGKTQIFPDNLKHHFVFYLVPESDGEDPRLVRLNIRVNGGRCPHLVRDQFQQFFRDHCKLKKWEFRWGPGMWPTHDDVDKKLSADNEAVKRRKQEGGKS